MRRPSWPVRAVTWCLVATQLCAPGYGFLRAADLPLPSPADSPVSPIAGPVPMENRTVPDVEPPSEELRFSPSPTDEEILRARVFSSPLVSAGGEAMAGENEALAQALLRFRHREDPDDATALEEFLAAHPRSPRRLAILASLAGHYRRICQFSRALQTWEEVWSEGQAIQEPDARALVDEAVSHWANFLVTLGRMADLESLLEQLEGREMAGSAATLIDDARGALGQMRDRPERTFKCGPYSLIRIRAALGLPDPAHPLIMEEPSTATGTSLHQNWLLAQRLGMDYQMAKRQPGSAIPLPAMIHWKLGHCSAVVQAEGDRYLIQDPTFPDTWVSANVLDQEASGYFLIPGGPLARGWSSVSEEEGQTVWATSTPTATDVNAITSEDEKTCQEPGGGGPGMAQYAVHLLRWNLNITDVPVGYQPPRGPAVVFRASYNSREVNQPAVFNYSNLGKQWTFDWLAYVEDDPAQTNADVKVRLGGGGAEVYDALGDGTFATQQKSQTRLVRTSTNSYDRIFTDGSKQVFTVADSATPRKVFMSAVVDPAGNSIDFIHDEVLPDGGRHRRDWPGDVAGLRPHRSGQQPVLQDHSGHRSLRALCHLRVQRHRSIDQHHRRGRVVLLLRVRLVGFH